MAMPGVEATVFTVFTPSSQAQQEEVDESAQRSDEQDGLTSNFNSNVSLTPEESGAGFEHQRTTQLLQDFSHEQVPTRNTPGLSHFPPTSAQLYPAELRQAWPGATDNESRDSIDDPSVALDPTRVEQNGMTMYSFPEDTSIDEMFNSFIHNNMSQQ